MAGLPSNSISPLQGWYRPEISLLSVDLPQPLAPTTATLLPGSRVMEKSVRRLGTNSVLVPSRSISTRTSRDLKALAPARPDSLPTSNVRSRTARRVRS